MKRILCFSIFIVSSSFAFASTQSNVDTISAVHSIENGEAYLYLSSGDTAQGACDTNYPYTYDASSVSGQVLHSSILAAFMAEKPVKVYIDGCLSGKPKISRINVYK